MMVVISVACSFGSLLRSTIARILSGLSLLHEAIRNKKKKLQTSVLPIVSIFNRKIGLFCSLISIIDYNLSTALIKVYV